MKELAKKLKDKLISRKSQNSYRELSICSEVDLVDFTSNDYLGFSRNVDLQLLIHDDLVKNSNSQNGATGSRLLSGNSAQYNELEQFLATFYTSPSALIFNSGYVANIGFFSCVPLRNDIVLYDSFIHASIRDGLKFSDAKSYAFNHNSLLDLETKINKYKQISNVIYVVTESVFSMDGDSPDLVLLTDLCASNGVYLIIDEAHALGVFGSKGTGLINDLDLEDKVFARVVTFGKALGVHGAAILSNKLLRDYLINFSRPFIYTTAISPHALSSIKMSHQLLLSDNPQKRLHKNIYYFKKMIKSLRLSSFFILSDSSIQSFKLSGTQKIKEISLHLKNKGFDVRPILSPTVPLGQERIRFCIHSYNTLDQIDAVLKILATFVA